MSAIMFFFYCIMSFITSFAIGLWRIYSEAIMNEQSYLPRIIDALIVSIPLFLALIGWVPRESKLVMIGVFISMAPLIFDRTRIISKIALALHKRMRK